MFHMTQQGFMHFIHGNMILCDVQIYGENYLLLHVSQLKDSESGEFTSEHASDEPYLQ